MESDATDAPVDETPIDDVETSASEAGVEEAGEAVEAPVAVPPSAWDRFKEIPGLAGRPDEEVAGAVYQALQREQALQHQLRQYQSIVPVASEYLSNREQYERWKQSQGQPAQAAAPSPQPVAEQAGWWNPPKVRDAYRQYLVKDESGREIISPDAPLDAKHALAEYQAYRADFARKFLENPEETLAPMVSKVAEARAQDLLQRTLARRDEEQFVHRIETENKDWLLDENGNASREALAAQKYVEDAKRYGIQGAESRWEFAKSMVERDLLLAFYQQTSAPGMTASPQQPPPQQPNPGDVQARQNMEYLRQQALRTPPRSSPGTADPRVPKPKMTFAEKLQAQLASEGMLQ